MKRFALAWGVLPLFLAAPATAQEPLRVICIEAHPDDCDGRFGGTAALYAAAGHAVKIVSLTNGDAGHQEQGGGALAMRRRAEGKEAGRRIGAEYEVLDNHDGELLPTLEVRRQVIRAIREWKADVVFSLRPNDYHPDHRYSGVLVMDAAYMVTVPNIVSDVPSLRKNPVFFYMADRFTKPTPHRPDVVVAIDSVVDEKIDMLDAHESQVYEWLAWHAGVLDEIPKDPAARKQWLRGWRLGEPREMKPEWREALRRWYGDAADAVQYAEAFELAEYGTQPDAEELRRLFPFVPQP
jgi:LmbE family N-acetylglucosaminyl deacetylase